MYLGAILILFAGTCVAATGDERPCCALDFQIHPQAITTSLGEPGQFWLRAKGHIPVEQNIIVTWESHEAIEIYPSSIVIPGHDRNASYDESFPVQAISRLEGRFLIRPLIPASAVSDDSRLFAQLKVAKYQPLIVLSMLIGWTYTVCWTIGDYFQAWTSFKRKSVVGLSIDFLLLNVLGNSCYAAFNVLMFSNTHIELEYFNRHPFGLNPVIINDVVYAVHAVFGNIVLIGQFFIYQSYENVVSTTVKLLVSGCVVLVGVLFSVALSGQLHWLDFLYILSYVKLSTNVVKYLPQVWMNYQRKSTEGFAISNRLLDLVGGLLSLLQMILNCWNFDDWQSLVGSPVKFGLGFVSIFFDVIFMIQHYVNYKNKDNSD